MNEALAVYLNLDMENIEKNEEIIRKIDELLLTVGMKYSGIMNLYISVDEQKRDETVFRAEELLRNTDWLKDILSYRLMDVTKKRTLGEKSKSAKGAVSMPTDLTKARQLFGTFSKIGAFTFGGGYAMIPLIQR